MSSSEWGHRIATQIRFCDALKIVAEDERKDWGGQLRTSSITLRRAMIILIVAVGCWIGDRARAEDAMTGTMRPFGSVPFAPDQDVACLRSALETGNPLTGPSTWILKAPPGCIVPWHSHTAEEQLIVVRGSVMAKMGTQQPAQLEPGGFAVMGSHMAHQFACQGTVACVMFIAFDRAYDIKWGKGSP
jgi:hypothetical protein